MDFIHRYEIDLIQATMLCQRETARMHDQYGRSLDVDVDASLTIAKTYCDDALAFLKEQEATHKLQRIVRNGQKSLSLKLRHVEAMFLSLDNLFPSLTSFYADFGSNHPEFYQSGEVSRLMDEYANWDTLIRRAFPEEKSAESPIYEAFDRLKEVVDFLLKEAILETLGVRQSWILEFATMADLHMMQNKECSLIAKSKRKKGFDLNDRLVKEHQALDVLMELLDGVVAASNLKWTSSRRVRPLYGKSSLAPGSDTRKPPIGLDAMFSDEFMTRAAHALVYLIEWNEYQASLLQSIRCKLTESYRSQARRCLWFHNMTQLFAHLFQIIGNAKARQTSTFAQTIGKTMLKMKAPSVKATQLIATVALGAFMGNEILTRSTSF